jgi:hypothetical protein
MNEFINGKIDLAKRLYNDVDFATYGDATLILCAALSAIAAKIWPGRNIDSKRFPELIACYTNKNLKNDWVSIPLLHQDLKQNKSPFTEKEYPALYENFSIITGDDIDISEKDLLSKFSQFDKKKIREYSYPNLIYKELRCVYVHEYDIGNRAFSSPLTLRQPCVSYVKFATNDNIKIHFHFDYLLNAIRNINTKLQPLDKYFNLKYPDPWWIEGA